MFEELRALGYEGGYDAVRRYARVWAEERTAASAEAYVPLAFAPGEVYQFDWSHDVVVIAGTTTTVKVAHLRLCHSRMLFVRAYPRESQEMVFDAHDRAFGIDDPASGLSTKHRVRDLGRVSSKHAPAPIAGSPSDLAQAEGSNQILGGTWRDLQLDGDGLARKHG